MGFFQVPSILGSLVDGEDASHIAEDAARSSPILGDQLGDMVKKNASWLDQIGNFLKGLWQWLQSFVLGIVDNFNHSHQKQTEEVAVKAVEEKEPQFIRLAKSLGLDDTVGKQLEKDTERATRDAFGFFGLTSKPAELVEQSLKLQETLTRDIHDALLVKYGSKITDQQANVIAMESAAAITGLNLEDLQSDNPALRLQADKPTKGIGGLLFGVQETMTDSSGKPKTPTIGNLEFDSTALNAAMGDIREVGRPAASPAVTPPGAPAKGTAAPTR